MRSRRSNNIILGVHFCLVLYSLVVKLSFSTACLNFSIHNYRFYNNTKTSIY
jgi:hypothetical protein